MPIASKFFEHELDELNELTRIISLIRVAKITAVDYQPPGYDESTFDCDRKHVHSNMSRFIIV